MFDNKLSDSMNSIDKAHKVLKARMDNVGLQEVCVLRPQLMFFFLFLRSLESDTVS